MNFENILWLFAAVALGALVGWISNRKSNSSDETLTTLLQGMERQNQELAGRVGQMADENRKSQAQLSKAVEDRLDKVGERMGKGLEDTATKTAKSLGEIQTRLNVIDEAQKNLKELSGDIVGLQDILSNKQARGVFGEGQLMDIVTMALPPSAYSFQTSLSNGKVVDCLIVLPNPPGSIGIDSKFPLESYHAIINAQNDQDEHLLKLAKAAFRVAMKKHINDISDKYIIVGETAESALMFLPSEAVYAELHTRFNELVEESYRKKVWIVSPTTLMATLNTVRAVLKDVRMREQAGVIQKELGGLMKDVVLLDNRVDKLAKHFNMAERDILDIQTSTGRIARKAEKIDQVQLEDAEKVVPPLIKD
jgi:DNA recombination protein RmuC